MNSRFEWLNEPPAWNDADGVLTMTTGDKTDFWRETHYGFIRDSGTSATGRSPAISPPRSNSARNTKPSTIRPA